MANLDSKPEKALDFDDFGPGPYTLYGHNMFIKRAWDCKTLQTVSVEDVMGARIDREEIYTLSFGKGIKEVEPGVIELFPNLLDLITEVDVRKIGCTPALEELLKRNHVILRGPFNSPAEKLAKKLGLRFIHKNIFLSSYYDEDHDQGTTITLCFQLDEAPFFWRNDITRGISPGCNGGGTVRTDLDEDFYAGYETTEAFADDYVGAHHWEKVRANKELADFLKEANRRLKK